LCGGSLRLRSHVTFLRTMWPLAQVRVTFRVLDRTR